MVENRAIKGKSKIKKNRVWNVIVILLVIGLLVVIIWNPFKKGNDVTGEEGEHATLEGKMCSSIRGTPAWADSEGNIIDYGYKETYVTDDLIKDKIYFLYNPGCGWCHKQIEYFGEEWQKYVDSGYTIDCKEILAVIRTD